MTEDEAKVKWCPFTRVGEQASGAAENRPDGSYNCIASACMAWRGREMIDFQRRAETSFRRYGNRVAPTTADVEGFCGLAGQPQ